MNFYPCTLKNEKHDFPQESSMKIKKDFIMGDKVFQHLFVQHIPDTRTWSIALWLWSPWHRLSVVHSHCGKKKHEQPCSMSIQQAHLDNVCKCCVSHSLFRQPLTARISLCEGQCRLWFAGCGRQSREYHPQWTSSPNLLAGACHSAAWTKQMHQTNCCNK